MDPIAAVGLASSILTFVDFAGTLISGANEIYRSPEGVTNANADLKTITDDLLLVAEELVWKGGSVKGIHESALCTLAEQCRTICTDIRDILQKLTISRKARRRKSIKAQFHSMLKDERIKELKERLQGCRAEILLRLTLMLRDQQSSIGKRLEELQTESRGLKAQTMASLEGMRHDILEAVKAIASKDSDSNTQDPRPPRTGDASRRDIRTLAACLKNGLLDTITSTAIQHRILRHLFFSSIHSREDSIRTVANKTFEWILEKPLVEATELDASYSGKQYHETSEEMHLRTTTREKFLSWLESDSGVFHISGKAGSGKSTLMKFISQHPKVQHHLRHWSDPKPLVLATFYFYSPAGENETSILGLFRSILYQCLASCCDLIPIVFPEQWELLKPNSVGSSLEASLFRPSKIKEGFEAFIKNVHLAKSKFCLFVDGLDEYEGDALDQRLLAESLSSWAKHDNLKICTSARPNIEFLTTFPGTKQTTIHLHALNRRDIWLFSRHMFEKDRNFSEVQSFYAELVNEIVKMSQGVFLWAFMVVRLLLSSVSQKDSLAILKKKLRAIPKDLNTLYEKLYDSIDEGDRRKANFMLLLVLKNPWSEPLNAIMFSWLDDLDETFPPVHAGNFQIYSSQEVASRLLRVEFQLHGISKGLLELAPGPEPSVQFFHRTLRDYLFQPNRLAQLHDSVPGFDECDYYGQLKVREFAFTIGYTNHDWLKAFLTSEFVQSGRIKHQNLACLERVFSAGQRENPLLRYYMMGNMFERKYSRLSITDCSGCSFVHTAAFYNLNEYVLHRVRETPTLVQPSTGLHPILSRATGATWDDKSGFGSVLQVMQAGLQVTDCVPVRENRGLVPVWLLVAGLAIDKLLRLTSAPKFTEALEGLLALLSGLVDLGADRSCSFYILETGLCRSCINPMRYEAQGLFLLTLGGFINLLEIRNELSIGKCGHGTYNCHSAFPGEQYKNSSSLIGSKAPFHSAMLRSGTFRVLFIKLGDLHLDVRKVSWRIS